MAAEHETQPPASQPTGQPSPPWQAPPSRRGWMFAAIWLVYLVPTLEAAWQLDSLVRRVAGVATVLLFSAFYVGTFYRVRARRWAGAELPLPGRIGAISAMVALTLVGVVLIGRPGLSFCVYLSVMAVMVLPQRLGFAAVLITMATVEVAGAVVPGWKPDHGLTFSVFISALAVWGISQMIARNQELARAQAELAQLAVVEERTRFARDIHDILGHSLTVVTVKAELAGRLMAIDPQRAAKEIADVERLARDALADVRATVAGYREVSLAGELVSARAALAAAGICAELPGALDDVPGDRRELFGWAVREGVTNVIRHSGASRCRIVLTDAAIEILDDGRGPGPAISPSAANGSDRSGHGLLGLCERAAAVGSTVIVGRAPDDGGFRLRVGS